QTNQVAGAVSAIPDIIHQYMDQHLKEAVREGKGGKEVRERGGESEEEMDTSEEEEAVLTQFRERLKIVKMKAIMRRSRNQDLVRRQEYVKKKTQKSCIVTST
nr:hypothetical protein [Tanacetum cinerariifolium]